MSEPTTYTLDGPIATITMDDGKVNALSIVMLRSLHDAFEQAERDEAAVLLSGREKCLSAGFDINVFAGGGGQLLEMLTLGATLYERMLSFPRPVVVACNGHAIAAGAFLLLSADARIATDGPFRIGLNEVKIGLTVPWFAIELARHRLTPAHFDRAVVNATMYTPREAAAAGFVDRVLPAEDLRAASLEAATELAGLNPVAHAATKLRARAAALGALRAAIETELTVQDLGAAQEPA
ncbi:MAG TPA: crotonase/enoyl-CoA hydratase family protein [Solirubrobacteraceae bacterium]|jgi:enoyl-CoA hydratase|nr:crotonase/enoyl-CoA hydratase family protein [Solirubrobacteraceae bacterium]